MGQISVRYMGEIPALIPELMPMTRRPAINISYELAYFAPKSSTAPMAARMLLRSKPVFLETKKKHTVIVSSCFIAEKIRVRNDTVEYISGLDLDQRFSTF